MSLKLYLAHPFPTRRRMREWELRTERRTGMEILNPFYDTWEKDYIIEVDSGRLTPTEYFKWIPTQRVVEGDIEWIKSCDAVIAYLDGSSTIGTYMEIWIANQECDLPVYIIQETNQHKNHVWLEYCATEIFSSLTSFTRWLGKQAKKGTKK